MIDSILTERLVIRDFLPDDWSDLYAYLSDPEVVRFEPYDVFTESQCRQEARTRAAQPFFRAVCLRDTGRLIGNIYFIQSEPQVFMTWELGYVFNRHFHGRGYAFESCRAVLDQAFKTSAAHRVFARCNILNNASWRLLERLGFRREGCFRQKAFFKCDTDGRPLWHDSFEYAVLREEWTAGQAGSPPFPAVERGG